MRSTVTKRVSEPLPEKKPQRTRQRQMSELFYQAPTLRTQSDSEKPKLLKPVKTVSKRPDTRMTPQRRMSELLYKPPAATILMQSVSEELLLTPLPRSNSLPLPRDDGLLSASGARNPRHDCHSISQAEEQELLERFERLNSLSAVIDSKLQEQKEKKAKTQGSF